MTHIAFSKSMPVLWPRLCSSFAFEFVFRDFILQSQLISDIISQKAKDLHSRAHGQHFIRYLERDGSEGFSLAHEGACDSVYLDLSLRAFAIALVPIELNRQRFHHGN